MKSDDESSSMPAGPARQEYKYDMALLIDDNYIDNFLNKHMLSAHSFSKETHFSTNGQLALDLLLELSTRTQSEGQMYPDIMFVDLNMPVMSGIEFIREFMKSENDSMKKCTIVVLTSSIHDVDEREVQSLDRSIIFMKKPLTSEMLNSL